MANVGRDNGRFCEESFKDALDRRLEIGKVLLHSTYKVIATDIRGSDNRKRRFKLLSYLRLIDGNRLCEVGKRNERKGYRKNGNEEHIINGNRYDTTCYHKEQSRSASNRELFFFACFLQGSSHTFKLKQDTVLLFLTSCRQSLVFEGLLFVEQFIYILIDLFGCQLQKCNRRNDEQKKADNIECCHTVVTSLLSNLLRSSCGIPPRKSLERRDSDGLFSWMNSPTMWNTPSTYSLLWIL